jgi:PcfJ-like protein
VINKRWLLVVKKAQGLMASKKQFPHQWEIKHDRRSCNWDTLDSQKKPPISIFHLEELETLPYRGKMSSNFHGSTSLPYQFPVIKFLMRQIGRDYDVVFAELLARIPKKYHSTIQIERLILTKHKRSKASHKSFNLNRNQLYVDLESNVICYNPPISLKNKEKENREKPVFRPFKETIYRNADLYEKHSFIQLLTYQDFYNEAAQMQHCIRWYWGVCTKNSLKTSIWSLEINKEKQLTIQIVKGEIVQVRGFKNRAINAMEAKLLRVWAGQMGCKIMDVSVWRVLEMGNSAPSFT